MWGEKLRNIISLREFLLLGLRGIIAAAVVAMGMATFNVKAQQPEAVADLKDASGKAVGRATFTQNLPGGGVWIHVDVTGLTLGVHAIHVHTMGVCEGPAFLSAGGHFNPEGHKHGLVNPEGPHAGDLPNMIANTAGKARYETANYRITLGIGPNSLFKAGGTSLVIHAGPDDNMSDPAGNSGARVVCGVIARTP